MPDTQYSIGDLARLTGLSIRTIRYYIAQGLIPPSGESGPGAHYGQGHLDRLLLTKRLQAQHLPNAEIRARMERLSDQEVAGLLHAPPEPSTSATTSALDYIREVLGTRAGAGPGATPASAQLVPAVEAPAPPPVVAPGTDASRAAAAAAVARVEAPRAAREVPAVYSPPGMPRMRDVPAASPLPRAGEGGDPVSGNRPERSQWERLALAPNIELHVRRPLSRIDQRRVERLITIARQVLKEDAT